MGIGGAEGISKRAHQTNSLQQLQNSQHDVVDVAKSRGLGLLRVVKASGPVDGDVRLLFV